MRIDHADVLQDTTRLAELYRLALLDSPAEEAFDRLTRLAAQTIGAPVSLIAFIDQGRQFFKSCWGLPEPWRSLRQTPLSHSFCQYSVATGEALIVEDARTHPLFSTNPAIQDLGVVAYAGVPLFMPDGHALGTLCVIDHEPRRWTEREIGLLQDLARISMTELELRAVAALAEQRRRESDEEYREKIEVLEAVTDGFFTLDRSCRFTYINRRLEELLERARTELIGRTIWEEFPADLHPELAAAFESARREQRTIQFNLYYPPTGRWFELRVHPGRGDLSVYLQDITNHKQAERFLVGQIQILEMVGMGQPLAEILEALVQLIEKQAAGMTCSILLLDESGTRLRRAVTGRMPEPFNQAIDDLLIGPQAGSCGTAAYLRERVIVTDIATDPLWKDYREAALANGLRACWSTPIVGSREQVLGTFAMYYQEPRSPAPGMMQLAEVATHIASIAIERERMEERLTFLTEASTRLGASLDYETILESIAQLLVPAFADFCIIDILEVGASAQRAVAARDPARERVLQELQTCFPLCPDSPQPAAQALRHMKPLFFPKVTEEVCHRMTMEGPHRALIRQLAPGSVMAIPLLIHGRALGVLTLGRTEPCRSYEPADLAIAEELGRRIATALDNGRLYRKAQEALQIRNQFFSIASHELRTPITTLVGLSTLIQRRAQREGATFDDIRGPVGIIQRETSRLNRLIEQLLDISRIESGQLSFEYREVDLTTLVRQAVEGVEATLEQHTLDLALPDDPLVVWGDELRLVQVLQNLLANAVKYSPEGGTISLRAAREGERVALSIKDEGIGIPPEAIDQLFGRFYRASNAEAIGISGLGLGLYIVQHIVRAHGGEITVQSERGVGSTFTVRLPPLPQPERSG